MRTLEEVDVALVDMKALLRHAYEHGYAVGAFAIVDLGTLTGVMEAAEHCQAPAILAVAEPRFVHYDPELLLPAIEAAARRATVPVAIHLEHCSSPASAVRAIRLGCNGITATAADGTREQGIARIRKLVDLAHGCGIAVVGAAPAKETEDEVQHAADAAARYVEETGIDFLAVSAAPGPECALERLRRINGALRVPLVLHGEHDTPDEHAPAFVRRGVAMVTGPVRLEEAATAAVRSASGPHPRLLRRIADAVAAEAERCIRRWGGAERSPDILLRCPAWGGVEHLITYNVEQTDGAGAAAMMNEGRRVLAEVPGVRAVLTGEAVNVEKARYRYCWLVRFAHPAVIDSYRDHPLHAAFADDHFRPVAPDRMSIDYRLFDGARTADDTPSTAAGAHPDA